MTNAMVGHTKERVKFENPPITELVVSLFHVPLPELKAQHIGIYWGLVFATNILFCQQQHLVIDNPSQQFIRDARLEIFPLPRFWFLQR